MIQALLVSSERAPLSNIEAVFLEDDMQIAHARSGAEAVSKLSERFYDIVVADDALADMTGLELAGKMVVKNPMSNFAVVSALTHEDFHEASEGLGILMQLSPQPGREEAGTLLAHLKKILALTGKAV